MSEKEKGFASPVSDANVSYCHCVAFNVLFTLQLYIQFLLVCLVLITCREKLYLCSDSGALA
jgi:hypothetical protein